MTVLLCIDLSVGHESLMHDQLAPGRFFIQMSSALIVVFSVVLDSDQVLIAATIINSTNLFISILHHRRFISHPGYAWRYIIRPIQRLKLGAALNRLNFSALPGIL